MIEAFAATVVGVAAIYVTVVDGVNWERVGLAFLWLTIWATLMALGYFVSWWVPVGLVLFFVVFFGVLLLDR